MSVKLYLTVNGGKGRKITSGIDLRKILFHTIQIVRRPKVTQT
jgi:hypothetical protein